MTFASLATGPTTKALGLMPDEGLALAVVLIFISILLELFLFRSIRDRRVLGEQAVKAATVVLAIISMLCFLGGLLILFN